MPRLGALTLLLAALAGAGCASGDARVLPPPPPTAPRAAPGAERAEAEIVCDRVLEDFSETPDGAFPAGWRARDEDQMPLATSERLWVVETLEGRKVLHAVSGSEAVTIGRPVAGWDLRSHPILEFEWKAVRLPTGGDETRGSTNDSAASVYVIWDIGFPFMVDGIRYAWSTSVPAGTRATKRLGHDGVVIVESGREHLGEWRRVRVDVLRDHAQIFEEGEPRPPDGIALLTDADATESAAEAYYADFRLCRRR